MRKNRLATKWIVLVLALAVFLVPGPAFSKSKTVALNTGWLPELATFPVWMGIQNGWFHDEGIDLGKKLTYFDSGMAVVEALPAGRTVLGGMGAVPWLVAALRHDAYAIAISNDDSTSNSVMVRPGSPILTAKGVNKYFPETLGSAETVRGKTVLVTTVSSGHYALATWLKRIGLTESDIVVKNMDQGQALAAYDAGIGDAVVLWAPFMYTALSKGWVIANMDSQKGANQANFVVVSKQFADQHPDQVAKALKVYLKGIDRLKAEGAQLAPAFVKFLNDWAGQELSVKDAGMDIENHTVYSLEEQLALFDDSHGPSEMDKWIRGSSDFFVKQGKFTRAEMDKVVNGHFINGKFLKMIAEEK
ncbi:hypothetical protein DSCA_18240 [Desulfosarcina alkanivorans]|uniref:Nitrate ABC transporter substrate-binding protein n=1 Tax=Desulfosarcina alkanivorans TaxID=571177 RepID=A0A5K7YNI0_9BACT|nr:ABC transporter substrate-binding protein [Desulfosarcina alkanivorans]BBO67894.1 hypothetical protein DSCA_18240 [Desulfosarcina alkanivorans]